MLIKYLKTNLKQTSEEYKFTINSLIIIQYMNTTIEYISSPSQNNCCVSTVCLLVEIHFLK